MVRLKFTPPAPIDQPELFFALVGAAGTDLESVSVALGAELNTVGYKLEEPIRLSRLIAAVRGHGSLHEFDGFEDERLEAYMDAGDEVRARFRHGGILAALAVAEIMRVRHQHPEHPARAFLFRSLKHPKEIDLLRAIYGKSLVVIAVHEAHEDREQHLRLRLERSRGSKDGVHQAARVLMQRDQAGRADPDFGQNVRKAFPLADFFLSVGSGSNPRGQIERLIHLLFGHPHKSPTPDEYAMFMAQAVALRSADMSRQVGAVIVDRDHEVVAAGCNEVPKPHGGVYWSGDTPDRRDFALGADPNAIIGQEVLCEVFSVLRHQGWLHPDKDDQEPKSLASEAQRSKIFKDARIGNLIEFGRVVHAEMNALVSAARKGTQIGGHDLYCTTFPCHVCGRHIIGAGIARVVYIEPYPKSLAVDLYPGALTLGENPENAKVAFCAFTGVAPRRYSDFFRYGRRKDDRGYARAWDPTQARPRFGTLNNPHLLAEKLLCDSLDAALEEDQRRDDDREDSARTPP